MIYKSRQVFYFDRDFNNSNYPDRRGTENQRILFGDGIFLELT